MSKRNGFQAVVVVGSVRFGLMPRWHLREPVRRPR